MTKRRFFCLALLAALFAALPARADSTLPSRRPEVVIPLLKNFPAGAGLAPVDHILGAPEIKMKSNINVFAYVLSDRTTILVGTPLQGGRVLYIRHARGHVASELLYAVDPTWVEKSH